MGGSSAPIVNAGANTGLQNVNAAQGAQQTAGTNPQYQSILDQFRSGAIDLNTAQQQIGQMSPQAAAAGPAQAPAPQFNPGTQMIGGVTDMGGALPMSANIGNQTAANANQAGPITNAQMLSQFMSDPTLSRQIASAQALSSPTLAGVFGPGGQLSQAQGQYTTASGNLGADRNALMGRDQSYGLTDQDLAAYGQASGNIARMGGAQQSSMAQALANRGLGAADSGTAQQGFSNAFGNQMEQLAGLQSNIAQNRIQTAQGLAQARTQADLQQQSQAQQYGMGLSGLGQNAINATQAGNLAAQGQQTGASQAAAGLGLQNQAQGQNVANEQFAQTQATSFNPMGALSGAISGGMGALAGGLGASIGVPGLGGGGKNIMNAQPGGSGSAGGTPSLADMYGNPSGSSSNPNPATAANMWGYK